MSARIKAENEVDGLGVDGREGETGETHDGTG